MENKAFWEIDLNELKHSLNKLENSIKPIVSVDSHDGGFKNTSKLTLHTNKEIKT